MNLKIMDKSTVDELKKASEEVRMIGEKYGVDFFFACQIWSAITNLHLAKAVLNESLFWLRKNGETDENPYGIPVALQRIERALSEIEDTKNKERILDVAYMSDAIGTAVLLTDLFSLSNFVGDCARAEKEGVGVEEYYQKQRSIAPDSLAKVKEIYSECMGDIPAVLGMHRD